MPRQGENNGPDREVIGNRLVLNFPGFIDIDTRTFFGRLEYSAQKTSEIFAFNLDKSTRFEGEGNVHPSVEYKTTGDGWSLKARFVQFDWRDIVGDFGAGFFPVTFLINLLAYLAFFFDGTIWRYLKTSKLYFSFSIYPLALVIVFATIAVIVATAVGGSLGMSGMLHGVVVTVLALAIWLLLCRWPGSYFFLPMAVSNWCFARQMILQTNTTIRQRIEQFSADISQEVKAADYDEILLCCHSFGSVWAVCALSMALERDPDLLAGKNVRILALGSSHLKVALCRKGIWIAGCLQRVVDNPAVFWHEFQSKDDAIAFYKANPFKPIGVTLDKKRYRVDRVRFKLGLHPPRYRKLKRSLYRVHTQYTRHWDKPVDFDLYLRIFGPFSARELAYDKDLHKQLLVSNTGDSA